MAIRTLEELNLEYVLREPVTISETEHSSEAIETRKHFRIKKSKAERENYAKRGTLAYISVMLLLLAMLVVILSALASSSYSYYSVLTSSMENEIPKGSLIVVHHTDAQNLEIGDNITFMRGWKTTVTHKIADIYENHGDSGYRGFLTKGTNNQAPDEEIVLEENVIGKVIYSIAHIGAAIEYLGENTIQLYSILGACIVFLLMFYIVRQKTLGVKEGR